MTEELDNATVHDQALENGYRESLRAASGLQLWNTESAWVCALSDARWPVNSQLLTIQFSIPSGLPVIRRRNVAKVHYQVYYNISSKNLAFARISVYPSLI